jgi:hypothetical protein
MNIDGDLAQQDTPSSNDAILASQGLSRLGNLAAISFVVVLGPLFVYAFWKCLGSWGWWRVGNAGSGDEENGRAVKLRRQYVRTWHGWVEEKDGRQGRRDLEAQKPRGGQFHEAEDPGGFRRPASLSRAIKSCLRSRAVSTDYDRIFWDHRKYEENEPIRPRYWWQKWLSGNTDRRANRLDEEKGIVRSASSGFRLEEAGTVRRRPGARLPTDLWASGSDETRRAIESQLLLPRKYPRFTRGNPRPPSPIKVGGVTKAGKDRTVPPRHSSLPQRAMPGVQFPTPPFARHLSALFRHPSSVFEDRDLENGISERGTLFPQGLLKPMPIGGPKVPQNSLESPTSTDATSSSDVRELCIDNQAVLTHVDGSRTLAYETGFANSLGRRLEIWASPMLLDPLAPGSHDTDGTAGRRASPAMGWREVQDRPEAFYEDLEGYEAEHSTDQSIQPSGYSSFRGTFDRCLRGRDRVTSAGDGVLLTTGAIPQIPVIQHSIASDCRSEAEFLLSVPPRHSIKVRTRPDRMLHASISRARSLGSIPNPKLKRSSLSGGAEICQPRPFTSSERAFLDLMDRKLNWLHHELSPGFRCPEDNPAESYLPISSPGHKKGSRRRAQGHENRTPGSGRGSSLSRTSRVRQQKRVRYRVPNPKLDSWRIAVNNLRKGARHTASAELLCAILQVEEGGNQDPVEGTIDTAAWILRRPPQGWPADPGRDLSVAEKMIVKHQDWEKIRRPHRIMKYRYPRKERSTAQLVRKLSGRVLKALYSGSTTSATGGAADVPERGHSPTSTAHRLVQNSSEPLPPTLRLGLHQNGLILAGDPASASGSTAIRSVGI